MTSRRGERGFRPSGVAEIVEPLFDGAIEPIAVDAGLARRAAEIRIEHYHRCTRRALAGRRDPARRRLDRLDRIATSDSDVLAVAAELGIETG